MRFRPGERVSLFLEDGTEVVARPFYFKDKAIGPFDMELIAEDGTRIRPISEAEDVFAIDGTGRRLYLQTPSKQN